MCTGDTHALFACPPEASFRGMGVVSIALAMPMPHQPLSQVVAIAVVILLSQCFPGKRNPYIPLYLEISCSGSGQSGSKAAAFDNCQLFVVIQAVTDIITLSVYLCMVR